MVGSVLAATGASAATSGISPICNNIKSGDGSTCNVGDLPHGIVTWQVDGSSGDLVLQVDGVPGFEWSTLFVCVPYAGPTNSADCVAGDSPLTPGTQYTVTGESATYNAHDTALDCQDAAVTDQFTIDVKAAALPSTDFSWAIHLGPCTGNTDEAFGTVTQPATTTTTEAATTTTTEAATTTTTAAAATT